MGDSAPGAVDTLWQVTEASVVPVDILAPPDARVLVPKGRSSATVTRCSVLSPLAMQWRLTAATEPNVVITAPVLPDANCTESFTVSPSKSDGLTGASRLMPPRPV